MQPQKAEIIPDSPRPVTGIERRGKPDRSVAYFSMEIGLASAMPTYSGGLGVLAGDTIRSAADLGVPMVAVTLLHRKGYFTQKIDPSGWQKEEPSEWNPKDFLTEEKERVAITIEGRTVHLRAWKFELKGIAGFIVPVYLLDSDLPENDEGDRTLTHYLYGGDPRYRLCQEAVLGMGGVRMLRALGHKNIAHFHMNEGHASLLALELLDERAKGADRSQIIHEDVEAVRKLCVFTTHTPVSAGHDKFPMDLVNQVLGRREIYSMQEVFCCDGVMNMTYLALNLSHYVNGVAKKHGEVSQQMFARYKIDSITNGIHAGTWLAEPFQHLFDRVIPDWRKDSFSLRYALNVPKEEIWTAHELCKERLIERINKETDAGMDPKVFTIGFARRATAYKRAALLFDDMERLKRIANAGPLQLVFSGKAHPHDKSGKEIIQRIVRMRDALKSDIKVAYLEDYGMELGKIMTSGADIWLNTPEPPLEASGTSGMKAALNGVPSLSILDGWWIEGCIEGITGWAIGENGRGASEVDRSKDAISLYDKLEKTILPLFYQDRNRFIDVMRHAIALNGSFFNTQRMVQQYVLLAYFR